MSTPEICKKCGNSIPTWAPQCTVCQRIEKENKRFNPSRGTSKRRSYSPARQTAKPATEQPEIYRAPKSLANRTTPPTSLPRKHKPTHKKPGEKSKPISQTASTPKPPPQSLSQKRKNISTLKQRVQGLNRLLTEIYGRPMQLSKILQNNGHSQQTIRNWKTDRTKLTQLIDQIVTNLNNLLHTEFPTTNIEILNAWYGLNQPPHPTHTSLATHLQTTPHQITTTLKTYLHHLRQHKTRTQLEQHILQTATSLHHKDPHIK